MTAFFDHPERLQDTPKTVFLPLGSDDQGTAGFQIIQEAGGHTFKSGGKGVTGFILLAQSHAAFHSYPEYNYMALDIYSCGEHDPKPIVRVMERHLKPKKLFLFLVKEGEVVSDNIKRGMK